MPGKAKKLMFQRKLCNVMLSYETSQVIANSNQVGNLQNSPMDSEF